VTADGPATPDAAGPGQEVVARTPVRRYPVPVCEPPVLGQPGAVTSILAHVGAGQGVLALELPRDQRARRLAGEDPFSGPQPASTGELPAAAPWASRYLIVLHEVLAGQRPPQQLLRWTAPDVYTGVQRSTALAARARQRTGAPRRPPVVQRVLVCAPGDGIAEVTAVMRTGGRVRANALRMEGWDRRWRVTAIELG
jgi:hypothetical protein